MFISNATKYLENGYFIFAKMLLICVAGLNMVVFHAISSRNQPQWENSARLPLPSATGGSIVPSTVDLGGRLRTLDRFYDADWLA